ncbi:tryptophan halogenase family protein [Sphingomonas baiyangensis]|uniref:Tryptophan 7-halogenase n=1 Tax=Sphingomonas baiyangensis TaxID=2572576 RepID=A0A4U1L7T5_9SPHN|nr:tryptophan halogenase family protein [Sphingomonas baiyangensis]TKD52326.1 tryptophan 7-halogenase [Sphingomonas baiyangensis]
MRSIVIAGGGTAGWMAAAAFARFLPREAWRVVLVESEAIGTVGVGEATIPQIQLFNHHLGLDEDEFLAATQGSIKLGIEFRDWVRPGHAYMHGFGQVGRGLGLAEFHHYWLRAHEAGTAAPFGAYSLNNMAAAAGRFARFEAQGPVPPMPYAFHFDAGLYAAYLRRHAEAGDVVRHEGRIVAVEPGEGGIAALLLDGERRIAGDLFIDCTGFRGLLIGEALGVGYHDWRHWLPCDRALAVPSARVGDPAPYTRATARRAGWQWRIPLQHRTGNGYVYASAHVSDDGAAATLLANLDGEPLGDPRPLAFTTGKREAFWAGNCIALGLSSGFLEPLESTSIHLIQTAVARILAFLPADRPTEADRAEYNRLTHVEYDRIRDFLILHYHANQRVGEPLWDAMRALELPEELARKLDLWRASARLSRRDDELFAEPGWTQVLIGQEILPERHHPLADAPGDRDLAAFLSTVADVARRTAAALPPHGDFLRGLSRAPQMKVSA